MTRQFPLLFFALAIAAIGLCPLSSQASVLSAFRFEDLRSDIQLDGAGLRPSPLLEKLRKFRASNKKLTAAVLAFPFPFGIVGLHRIYLGTAPYVHVVYIATIGGVFGILPLIDFIAILAEKDLDRFVANQKVFMWVD